jgi:virginiamycin A acetyltransferase
MSNSLKIASQVVAAILVSPLTISYLLLAALLDEDLLLSGYSQFLSLLPGKTGNYLRAGFYRFILTQFRPNAIVSFLCLLSQRDTEIEGNVYIGPQCNLGKCHIGKNTLLGSGVHVMSGKNQHHFARLDVPIKDQGGQLEKITVGEDCWVGNGAMIMANIGDHCIVGSGSVVIEDVPGHSIVAGNPAKVIGTRTG